MYLIISDVNGNATLSRAFEVFHNEVDVTGLRVVGEEKVHQRSSRKRSSDGEGPMERSDREDPTKNVPRRRSTEEASREKV